jgi:hypothetical protein
MLDIKSNSDGATTTIKQGRADLLKALTRYPEAYYWG